MPSSKNKDSPTKQTTQCETEKAPFIGDAKDAESWMLKPYITKGYRINFITPI
jgi:hypothetical protein